MRNTPVLIALCLAGCMASHRAGAQINEAAMREFRQRYDNCVYNSVAAQLRQYPIAARQGADISMLAEQAFMACGTEGEVLVRALSALDVQPNTIATFMLTIRTQIKRDLAAVAANPDKYLRSP